LRLLANVNTTSVDTNTVITAAIKLINSTILNIDVMILNMDDKQA